MEGNPIASDHRPVRSGLTKTLGMLAGAVTLLVAGKLVWTPGVAADQGEANTAAVEQAEVEFADVERFTDGDATHGAALFKRYCRGCHGADGRGGAQTFMPHIQNLTKKGYIELVPDSYLFMVIAEGGEAVGKNSYMPAWKTALSVQDIQDLIAHIRSLPTY